MKVIPRKAGEAYGIVVRPKYQEYVSGITFLKQADLFDLRAMAKPANVNVTLTYTEKGEKTSMNIDPVGDAVGTGKMQLLKNKDYPEGRYVLHDDDGNMKMRYDFKAIGNAHNYCYMQAKWQTSTTRLLHWRKRTPKTS